MTTPQQNERVSEPISLPVGAAPGSIQRRQPSRLRSVVASLLALTLVLGIFAAYYGLSGFFNANGSWYGTMHIHMGGRTVAIETYMNVSTSLTGSISGEGIFCVPLPFQNTATFAYSLSGHRAFPLPTTTQHDQQQPIALTAQYTVPLVLGITLPLGPSLRLEGNATTRSFHLSGGDGTAATVLDMTHDTKSAFMAACTSLAPLQ
jgi:hypothetical protein